MTISMSTYAKIRDEIVVRCTPCTDQNLQKLKVYFKDNINSTRREEDIKNVRELICILEKRNVSNTQNLDCLKRIASLLHKQDLLRLFDNDFRQPVINIPIPPPASPIQVTHLQAAPVLNPPSPIYHERIYRLIIDQIGNKWKDLARNLGISEGKIDELTDRYRYEPAERVREILKYHERNSPPHEVWVRLMDALINSRRKDLRIEVQRILIGN